MSNKPDTIKKAELKTLIASIAKEKQLNDVFTSEVINAIEHKITVKLEQDKFKKVTSNTIAEAVPSGGYNALSPDGPQANTPTSAPSGAVSFPKADTINVNGADSNTGHTDINTNIDIVPDTDLDQPKMGMAYTPELPDFLNKIEPAKIIIFSQNELSEGGENLANKPLRTFSDPDVKKSIKDYWIEEGKRKATVYLSKLEAIGELEFDFANGTAKFTEQRFDPDFEAQNQYKENPYKGPELPIEPEASPGEIKDMEEFIKNSPDFQGLMSDMVKKIIHDYKMTNHATAGLDPVQQFSETKKSQLKMIELVDDKGSFIKETTPTQLLESITSGNKKFLISESDEVQEWEINGKKYYMPAKPLSIKKCFVKK